MEQELPKGEFTAKLIEEVYHDIFNNSKKVNRDIDWTPKLCEWEEDGKIFYTWKIGNVYTNDAGKAIFDQTIKDYWKLDDSNSKIN